MYKQPKKKAGKLDFIKIKNLPASKDTTEKEKRQPMKEKISARQISDKGLISKIYKELLPPNKINF